MATILGLLECQRDILHGRRRRLLRNQQTHAELAKVLERNEADGVAMSRELQGKAAELAEQREAVLARISWHYRERYEAAMREGHRPFLALYDRGWVERNFMPSTLRPVPKPRP
jgi:hypothetical protein